MGFPYPDRSVGRRLVLLFSSPLSADVDKVGTLAAFFTDHPPLMILLAMPFIEFALLRRSNSIPCSRLNVR